MVLLQPKLNLRVSQKQILTPGLVQMVSVLALNKLELKEMINAEMMENPVLDELETGVPLLDEVAGKEAERDRTESADPVAAEEKKDPFDEIDFGSYFNDYLDPGFRSAGDFSGDGDPDRPSFENFLSKPSTLSDHLMWQLSSIHAREPVLRAAELIIGNLNEDGYLTASDEELLALASGKSFAPPAEAAATTEGMSEAPAAEPEVTVQAAEMVEQAKQEAEAHTNGTSKCVSIRAGDHVNTEPEPEFTEADLREALSIVRLLDPPGVAARDLRECLLIQLRHLRRLEEERLERVTRHAQATEVATDEEEGTEDEDSAIETQAVNTTPQPPAPASQLQAYDDAIAIADAHLQELQGKQFKEIARALGRSIDAVNAAFELIRKLDPKPGARYNRPETRLIEPDVAFVKQGDEYLVVMNDEDMPMLRLNPAYKRLLHRENAERDVRTYVKERYKSAIQLIKNIEQRKQTILKTCHAIIARQRDFLDQGIDSLKPMMIKEVAEEIGVHPSTVSRAVANKYVHTPQGVYELRFFFSESVQGPEGGATSLMILKRRVKKLIEEEDPSRPLTDEQIMKILQEQGIHVTRRTVAKYREDMNIPSTHQRRVKK